MPYLYITGGKQKPREADEWNQYQEARIVRFDPDTGEGEVSVRYESPPGTFPEDAPNFLFKASSIHGNLLYTCTGTEVLIYEVPGFRLAHRISLPCFNDLHHAQRADGNSVFVACTGLDMVFHVSMEGEVLREWDVLHRTPWSHFSRATDYRKIPTTKPHASHPSFVYEIGHDVWVTRGKQRDTVCLSHPGSRIVFGSQPHDGAPFRGRRYFTTVNAHVFIVDEASLEIVETFDLNRTQGADDTPLGWCRGILPLDERLCWIGFSRLRPTRFRENVSWIRNGFQQGSRPTRLALYDLQTMTVVQEVSTEQWGINALFSILPEPGGAAY